MVRPRWPPSQAWRTFLKNHVKDLIALDFFTVPTAPFRVLFVLVMLTHSRSVIAAVYARKSNDQLGLTDEQKSVTRQVEHARAYAVRKGWTVLDECLFVDDAVSGAEFATRPGFVRLMRALKPYPPFQVLVMAEESRLGREQIEVAYALKQLAQAGVRVWLYLEDRECTLDSPTDKLLMSVTAFADELERAKARQRTYDALARKARAGQVTGGVVFGYRNREVVGTDGRRQYVEREIAPEEAAVVRRIFELSASGVGVRRIAIVLNDQGALAPTTRRNGRPRSWAPSSVREILYRDLYRGVVVWNRIRKRDVWGLKRYLPRPRAGVDTPGRPRAPDRRRPALGRRSPPTGGHPPAICGPPTGN